MQAIVIDAFKEAGSVREMPEPPLDDDSVIVRITVAGVNPVDWKIRAGLSGEKSFPLVLGQDFAGVIERVGNRVTRVRPGDRVFGCARAHGSYADYTVIKDRDRPSPFSLIPSGIDDATAAALPTPGLTALASLDILGVTGGSEVLVIGAAGASGATAVQLARARGARVVAVVKRGQAQIARDFGAEEVIEVDDDAIGPLQRSHPEPFALIFDLVNDDAGLKRNLPLYAPGAKLVNTVHAADTAWFERHGFHATNIVMNQTPASSPEGLDTLTAAVLAGDLEVPIAGERALRDAVDTLDRMQAHELAGKYVLRIS